MARQFIVTINDVERLRDKFVPVIAFDDDDDDDDIIYKQTPQTSPEVNKIRSAL